MTWVSSRVKDSCTPLGHTYRNYDVVPSKKIYYGDYQYKMSFEGNIYHYDIIFLSDLYKVVNDETFYYRIQKSSTSINLYLHDKSVLDAVIDRYQHTDYLKSIHAPIDDNHLSGLLDSNTEYIYRNKYWYDRYPIKITFSRTYNMDIDRPIGLEIRDFVKGTFEDYRLYDSYTNNWYSNYLWLSQQDYDSSYAFLKLSYGDHILKIQKIKLMEK